MNDKTALVILSEIVQSLEDIREIAHELTRQSMSRGPPDPLDEQLEAKEWSAEQVHEFEDKVSVLSNDDREAATALLAGCREIEEKAVEMIKLCLEFTPPL
jgi:hypothetical protein